MHSADFFDVKGIDGSGTVMPLLIGKEIEAIVSLVRFDQFGEKEIADRAQNDLQWIKDKSVLHNHIIMQSVGELDVPLIPMKFGTIFKNRTSLQDAIKKDYRKFLDLLAKLKDKEEWSVKVFVDPNIFKKEIIANDTVLKNKEKELSCLPVGLAYFKEMEFKDAVEKRKKAEFGKWAQEILNTLGTFANDRKQGKILGKELTGETDPMILNAIFFLHKKRVSKFLKGVERLRRILKGKGLLMRVSGPWPPYNFV